MPGPVYPDWLTYKSEDTEAQRSAVTDVARRRGRMATTLTPVVESPSQAAGPAAPAETAGEQPLQSFREWVVINASHLIGRRFVPRGQLQAAKDAYAQYVALHGQRGKQRMAGEKLEIRRAESQARLKGKPPTPQAELDAAAARAAASQNPTDPLAARRAYRAGAPPAPPTLTQDAETAARGRHPGDPLGALGAVAAAKRPTTQKEPTPLIPSGQIGETFAGVAGAPELGLLSGIQEDPIGGWLKAKAYLDGTTSAMSPTQRKQVQQIIDDTRPSFAQIMKAWEDGYFGKGVEAQAQFVAVMRAALSPDEVQRLEHMGRRQRE